MPVGDFPHGAVDITIAVGQNLLKVEDISEIGEVLQQRRSGRRDQGQISIYRSVGVAAQDAAAAGLVLKAARSRGLGAEVQL